MYIGVLSVMYIDVCVQDLLDRNTELEELENNLKDVRIQLSDTQAREEKLKKEVTVHVNVVHSIHTL